MHGFLSKVMQSLQRLFISGKKAHEKLCPFCSLDKKIFAYFAYII